MMPALPLLLSLKILGAVALITALFVGLAAPRGNVRAWMIKVLGVGFIVCALGHFGWWLGAAIGFFSISYFGASIGSVTLVVLCAIAAMLPVSAGLLRLGDRAKRPSGPPADRPLAQARTTVTRREVLQAAAVAAPCVSGAVATSGFVAAAAASEVPTRVLRFAGLPQPLDGLRILQLSDMHLGFGRDIRDLESMLLSVERSKLKPDLIVLTGDIAEDVGLLPDALRLVAAAAPRLGVYSALGNHEHLRGVRHALHAYERSDVRLLLDEGAPIDVGGGATLYVAGIDDPVIVHTDIRPRLRAPLDRALDGAPEDAFKLLLSHRPEGFDLAFSRGVDLTLSGHTHGGQIGFGGKSAFEPLYPDGYLWGAYARGRSRLYTTSGFGAWFPFRVGCPAEAPMIELRRA